MSMLGINVILIVIAGIMFVAFQFVFLAAVLAVAVPCILVAGIVLLVALGILKAIEFVKKLFARGQP